MQNGHAHQQWQRVGEAGTHGAVDDQLFERFYKAKHRAVSASDKEDNLPKLATSTFDKQTGYQLVKTFALSFLRADPHVHSKEYLESFGSIMMLDTACNRASYVPMPHRENATSRIVNDNES